MFFTYLVYNLTLLFTVVFSLLVTRSKTGISEYGLRTLLFLSQAIPACIRKGIGTDYWNYIALYRLYLHSDDDHEIGFKLLAKILIIVDAHYQFFIVALTVLSIAPICYFIPKRHFSYFAIIYFFMSYLDIIGTSRQDIAVAIIVCGIISLYHKRGGFKYLIASSLSFLFHYSSIMYFPLVFLKNIRISSKVIHILLIIIVVVTAGAGVIEWIFNSSVFMDSPYGVYVASGYNREANVGTGLGVLANMLVPLLFLIFYSRSSRYLSHAGFFGALALIFIGSYLLATQIHIFGRLVNIFLFVPAFLVYPTCKGISPRYSALVFCFFCLMYLILFEKSIMDSQISLGNGLGISPYSTIFD